MDESTNESAKIIEKSEFRVFNKPIEMISFGYGIFLIIWGITVSFLSQSTSFTSFIPSIFGFLLTLFSIKVSTVSFPNPSISSPALDAK